MNVSRAVVGWASAAIVVGWATAGVAQAPKADAPGTVAAIDEDFERKLIGLERQRLEQLAKLAASQPAAQSAATYEAYFERALDSRLYRDAESVAERLLKDRDVPPYVLYLAEATNILAEVERGDFKQSVESLKAAIQASKGADDEVGGLPIATRMTLLELFFQKLTQNDQFALEHEALALINANTKNPAIRDYTAARLRRIDLIGKPAPSIKGTDLDGKAVSLADYKGQVVLVIFWASWCLPNAEEAEQFRELANEYRPRGLRVVGINLDTAMEEAPSMAALLPNIRRFVLDYNIPWPNLINGTGESDFAGAYAITDIPANVLIGRDGKVRQMDLDPSNIRRVLDQALGN